MECLDPLLHLQVLIDQDILNLSKCDVRQDTVINIIPFLYVLIYRSTCVSDLLKPFVQSVCKCDRISSSWSRTNKVIEEQTIKLELRNKDYNEITQILISYKVFWFQLWMISKPISFAVALLLMVITVYKSVMGMCCHFLVG